MMVAKSYYNQTYFAESFQKLNDLRESGETCDIRLLASKKEISAHKIVLASASDYFKNAIYGLFLNDSGKHELDLKEIHYDILSVLINYIYNGKIEIDSENVYDIYNAADYCLMNFLKEACLDFMQENLDIENCLKIWIIANNFKHEKLISAAGTFIFSNLPVTSNSNEFLSLSSEELKVFFKLWPKHESFDSIITAALKWAANKENWEENIINLLKGLSHTDISDDYLDNYLSKNELIQNSNGCNNWMINIYNEKSQLNKLKLAETEEKLKSENDKLILKLAEFEAELQFTKFLSEQPIIFMKQRGDDASNEFYKYNYRDGALDFYKNIKDVNFLASDCKTYRDWIYVVGNNRCERFEFDDIVENSYEPAFRHNHGLNLSSVVLNNSMYIIGGHTSENLGSSIDLNTKQVAHFSLLHKRYCAGLAVIDGIIYICGDYNNNFAERFDPREGRTAHFGIIPFNIEYNCYSSAAALPNQIYCNKAGQYKRLDLRADVWIDIEAPVRSNDTACLYSSYGKLHTFNGTTIYEYNNAFERWHNIASFPDMCNVVRAVSFEEQ